MTAGRSTFDVLRSTCDVLRSTFYVLRSTCDLLRSTFYVLRSTCDLLRSTFYVLGPTCDVLRSAADGLRSAFCVRDMAQRGARGGGWLVAAIVALGILGGACASPRESESADVAPLKTPDGRPLRSVDLPDLSKMAASVRDQIREQHKSMMAKVEGRGTPVLELSDAYGEMGKLLMAAQYADAAESCFLNAQTLNSSDFRWPYYLGQLYRTRGELAKSLELFERANQLQPDDVATLVWLGDIALAQGRPDAAEPRFARALSLQPGSLSARFGLGRTALARQDYRRAVTYLEEVLARDPNAAGAHYPLAMAYTGLGESKRADEHLRRRSEHEILPADPLMVELEELLRSPQTYEKLGIRALDRKDWVAAAAEFRKGLELEPASPALRHRLGTALAMMGDDRGARAEFEEVVRVSPGYARAQYSLAVLAVANGQHQEAIRRFSAALESEPNYAEARIGLAVSLRRTGRAAESLPQYERVLQENPRLPEAAFGYAMTLVQLRRYQAARDRLIEGRQAYPEDPRFDHALARLLAAAPDDGVRNGAGAIELVEELLRKQQRTLELGETMAMALADLGRYEEAVSVQRQLMAGAEKAALPDARRRLSVNLALYERGEPCRTPWAEGEMP